MSRGASGRRPSRYEVLSLFDADTVSVGDDGLALREHGSCLFKNGEGGIRTHEAAFTAHAISSRAP